MLPDVVLLGDIVAPMSSGVAARNLALYSRHDTTGQVAASLLTGRAGVLTQDGAGNASPYPLPDLVRTVETAGFWSTAAAVIGNVTLTGSAVANLGTVTVAGVTGFGYGATGSFSLGNTAPGGTLTVMAGGPAGSAVYPGVAAWGGNLSISEAGRIVADGPVSSSGTLSLGAGGDLLVSGSAVLGAGSTVRLTTAGTYLQDSGLVDAPTITLASTLASGTGISVSGGTIAAPGLLQVTSVAGISQSGGVLASDNTLTIGSGSGPDSNSRTSSKVP